MITTTVQIFKQELIKRFDCTNFEISFYDDLNTGKLCIRIVYNNFGFHFVTEYGICYNQILHDYDIQVKVHSLYTCTLQQFLDETVLK